MSEKELKLNIGGGCEPLAGYETVDRKVGKEAYPLDYPDGVADEIRASHVLEHFPFEQTGLVLSDWMRVLKPGGILKIAVPDFGKIVDFYREHAELPIEGYVMGGHMDEDDVHRAIFDHNKLSVALEVAGLEDIQFWTSDVKDCASLPVSLNLQGRKPLTAAVPVAHDDDIRTFRVGGPVRDTGLVVSAVMSVPRLGFMDNFFCSIGAILPLGINMHKVEGAFWGQCLERGILQAIEQDKPDVILTLDYDTVFRQQEVLGLLRQLAAHPEADAIAALQMNRGKLSPMMAVTEKTNPRTEAVKIDGQLAASIPWEMLRNDDIMRIDTAHFGLTVLRVSALKKMSHPWFWSKPGDNGMWEENRLDDDIFFWHKWAETGNTLFQSNRHAIGHEAAMIIWPDEQFRPIYQTPSKFWSEGIPAGVWK